MLSSSNLQNRHHSLPMFKRKDTPPFMPLVEFFSILSTNQTQTVCQLFEFRPQLLDSAIHCINHYAVNKCPQLNIILTLYPLAWCYPPFKNLKPDQLNIILTLLPLGSVIHHSKIKSQICLFWFSMNSVIAGHKWNHPKNQNWTFELWWGTTLPGLLCVCRDLFIKLRPSSFCRSHSFTEPSSEADARSK